MNAFEIRLEILKLAHSMLQDEYSAKRSKSDIDWTLKKELFESGKISEIPEYDLPKAISSEDILREADNLNNFISKEFSANINRAKANV